MSKLPKKDIEADVCIIGGGYTRLCTTMRIRQESPEKSIIIVEQSICGHEYLVLMVVVFLTLATKYTTLAKFYGEARSKKISAGIREYRNRNRQIL